jgi:hypothetical protein
MARHKPKNRTDLTELKELLSRHLDRETALRHGYKTAYSLIMNKFCTSTMQQ